MSVHRTAAILRFLSFVFYKAAAARVLAIVSAMTCGMVSLKLYGTYLDPKIYGVVVVALQIVGYLPYLDAGFRTTTNRDILAASDRETKLRLIQFSQTFYSLLTLALMPLALIAMTVYALTGNAAQSGQTPLFFIALGLSAALSVLVWSQVGLLIAFQAQTTFFLINAVASIVSVVAMWISLHAGCGVWAFPISTLAGIIFAYPIAIFPLKAREPSLALFSIRADAKFWNQFNALRRHALDCFRSQIAIVLLFTLWPALVGLICSAEDAAIYGVLCRFFTMARNLLQAAGEVAWPIVAEKKGTDTTFATFLLRLNAWIFGGAVGGLALTLSPFLAFYMGAKWKPAPLLVYLMAARLLITGSSSAASYVLIGMGKFAAVARLIEREMLAAVVLGAILGWKFGLVGVAIGFLISTVFGTFAPMFYACAQTILTSGTALFVQAWWRALLGCGVSLTVGFCLLRFATNAWLTLGVTAACAIAACSLGLLIGFVRVRSSREPQPSPIRLRDLAANF